MATRKPAPTNCERAIAQLSPDDQQAFTQFCLYNPSYESIRLWLQERGHNISIGSIQNWWQQQFPIGEQARLQNELMASARGIDPIVAHQSSLTIVCKLTAQLLGILDASDIDELNPSILSNLSDLLREQRQSAIAYSDRKILRDKRSLELAGGYRLAEILQTISADTNHAAVIQEFCKAALSQLETEVNGS